MLIPVIIVVSFIVFALMDLAPGEAIDGWDLSDMSPEAVAALRLELGLDDPLMVRYGRYMFRLIQGDLGVGDRSGVSVWTMFMSRLPNTLILASGSFLVGATLSIPLGVLAARRAGKLADSLITAFSMVGMSMPGFWLGMLLILVFSYQLGWLPAGGFRDGFLSVIMPAVCAGMMLLASATRQTRSSMLEVLRSDYLRTARAKGVPENVVVRKHALGNALIPIVTIMGISLGIAIAGTAVIEAVFAWPGIGRLIVESVATRDVTATTGAVVLTTILYVLVQLLVDLAYALIDPRIKAQYITASKKKSSRKANASDQQSSNSVFGMQATAATVGEIEIVDNMSKALDSNLPAAKTGDEIATNYATSDCDSDASMVSIETEKNLHEHVSYATRSKHDLESEKNEHVSGALVSKMYRKRSQLADIFHHLLRNKGAVVGLAIIVVMLILFASSFFIPFNAVTASDIPNRFSPPNVQFPFGTDGMGRNLFVRVIYATRFSIPIGFGATAIAAIVGVMLGALAAYYEGTASDEVIMRFSDILASIPGILLGMVIITTLGRSLTNLIIAVGVSAIPQFIRLSRASILSIKGSEYVEAARAIGLPSFRIIFTQVLPNGLSPIIVLFTSLLGITILISASLSFLGFGIPIPNPEWGQLVAAGRDNIRNAPWLTTFPGLFIMITVMAFNLLGDGLRDALDPKLKK